MKFVETEEMGRKVSNARQKDMQMVKGFYETAKINILIGDEEKKIKNACYEIGKIYASLHKSDFEQDFVAWMGIVNESEQKIENYKRQIEKIKSVKRCSCGAELIEGMGFCAACGKPVQKQETADEIRCIHCGKPVKKDAKFCIHCGMLMEKPEDPPVEEIKEQICSVCGAKQSSESVFCTECGNRMKENPVVPKPEDDLPKHPTCPTCGSVIPDGVNFCIHCGTPTTVTVVPPSEIPPELPMPGTEKEQTCPVCGERIEKGVKFCIYCGNPVKKSGDGNDEVVINSGKKICPKCGVEVEQDALFCTGCGEKLTQKEEIESENVCPNCGELLEGHPEYCTKCGRILIIRN